MLQEARKILVTYALPYANGSLHLGHLVGLIQTDIWVRFQKMQQHQCLYICGSDAHGTPIMIQADKTGITPEALVTAIRDEHRKDITDFLIEIDNYHTTHSPENKELVEAIYQKHLDQGNIIKRTIKQAFDPEKNMFLPDRFIKGDCPRCQAKDQYGDNCESCGATYTPLELKNAYSTLSGAKPIEKESEHYFFKLQNYENFLHQWTREDHLQNEVANKLDEWFTAGLEEWDISRDAPYFGFTIPSETQKYFYCWLDAPVGYIASFKNYCNTHPGIQFSEYWDKNSTTELYHFIGKDIVYFHALFWPAILEGANYRTPTAIFTHGFLTINGQKMSKSRGTFIKGRTYLNHCHPEFLRYYIAAKLSEHVEDIDIQFDDFMSRINSDLVGKFVNIASRSANFINKHFDGLLSATIDNLELLNHFQDTGDIIAAHYEKREFNQAVRQIMALADRANQYVDEKKPWSLIKDLTKKEDVQAVCSLAINLFRLLAIYLKPILPLTASNVETFLNCPAFKWSDKNQFLLDHRINEFKPLLQRIDKTQLESLKTTEST